MGKKYEDYLNVLRKVSAEYGLEVLDFQEIFGMPKDNLPSDLYQDGLHPNDKGHLLFAKLIGYGSYDHQSGLGIQWH